METFTSKLGLYGSNYRSPKATNSKINFSYEPSVGMNKENFLDTLRKEKQTIKPDDKQAGIVRAPSYEKRASNQGQPSYLRNIQDPLTTSSLNNLNSALVFNSPRYDGGGVTLFGSQDKNNYKSKFTTKPTTAEFSRPEEKPATTISNKTDTNSYSRVDQGVDNSISTRDKNRSVITSRTNNGVSPAPTEERTSDAVNIYNRILNGNKNSAPQTKEYSAQPGMLSKNNPQRASLEIFSKPNEKKKSPFEAQKASLDIDEIMKPPTREIERTTPINLQKKIIDDRRHERSPDEDRFSLTRKLTITTQEDTVPSSKLLRQPMTTKNSKVDQNIQNLYESLENVKKSLERQQPHLVTNKTYNHTDTSMTNHSIDDRDRNNYRPVTPKSTTKGVLEAKTTLQGIKNTLPSETKNPAREAREQRELNDASYESYLKGYARTLKPTSEQTTPSYITRPKEKDVSPVPTRNYEATNDSYSKYDHYSRQPIKNGYNNYENYAQNDNYKVHTTQPSSYLRTETVTSNSKYTRQEQPSTPKESQEKATKNLSDFITQVKPGMAIPVKKTIEEDLKNIHPQSTKHTSNKITFESQLVSSNVNNLVKVPSTGTHASLEGKSFNFPSKLGYKNTTPVNEEKSQQNRSDSALTSKQPISYYMAPLEKYLKNPYSGDEYFSKIYREHFTQSFQALNFCKNLKPIDPKELAKKKVYLPKHEAYKDKKTIIFDLDETLIHCNESTSMPCDVILPIKFPHGDIIEAGINIRPYAIECLEELSKYYEIIVFTASHSCYANVVLDYLDPQNRYIHHRLFRENCVTTEEGLYIKDLRIFANRNLKDMVIVDNAVYSFGYQLDNGIPIIPFYYNKSDTELKTLTPYLKNLYSVRDVREVNTRSFKLHSFMESDAQEEVIRKLF